MRGRGLIAVRKCTSSRVLPTSSKGLKDLFVQVDQHSDHLNFATVYFPPENTFEKQAEFVEGMERLSEAHLEDKLYILGDFNLPHEQWYREKFSSVAKY